MRETVSLHIGSPGVQIGNKVWELFSIEHNFNQLSQLQSIQTQNTSKLSSFYSEHSSSFTPRALFIDNEVSLHSSLTFPGVSSLPSDNLILAEDSEGNYFKSYSSLACNDLIQEKVRRQVESCSSLQGFLIYSSTAGGLSGLASNILEHLGDDLPKNTKLGVTLFLQVRKMS
jgi:tubulin alpha